MKRNWFSNFLPFDEPLIYDDVFYKTPEHFYQALKTINSDQRRVIASAETPGRAKRLGRSVTLRQNWDTLKFDAMGWALAYKFTLKTS